jgi:hypothetical protein
MHPTANGNHHTRPEMKTSKCHQTTHRVLLATLLSLTSLSGASADLLGTGYNKQLHFRLAGFFATTRTEIRVDSESGVIGETISFEDDLNLSERERLPLLDITYRFNPRHMIDFSYTNLSRSGSTAFGKEGITTDDIKWSAGAEIDSQFDSEVYRLAYGYSFVNDGKKEFGLLAGLHVTRFNVEISGTGSIVALDPGSGDEVEVEGEARRTYDTGFTVPLPVIGIHGSYSITPDLYLRGWGQFFSLKYEDYDGRLLNAAGLLEYNLTEHIGLGIGYVYYGYDLDVDGSSLNGSFSYDFRGPTVFISGYF